jgi:hypothetical protein
MKLPQVDAVLAVASIDYTGFNEKTAEAVIWLTSPEGLKVCLVCDLAGIKRALAVIADNQTHEEKKAGLRAISGGKASK